MDQFQSADQGLGLLCQHNTKQCTAMLKVKDSIKDLWQQQI